MVLTVCITADFYTMQQVRRMQVCLVLVGDSVGSIPGLAEYKHDSAVQLSALLEGECENKSVQASVMHRAAGFEPRRG